jgi:hypothetical protein
LDGEGDPVGAGIRYLKREIIRETLNAYLLIPECAAVFKGRRGIAQLETVAD